MPPKKILHILGSMERGGVETWLMNVFRNVDRSRFEMDVAVQSNQPAAYDEELRSLGGKILYCPSPRSPLNFARVLTDLLRQYGPYDVVHSHVHHYSGFTLRISYKAGVPIRIAHSHNDIRPVVRNASLARRCYLTLTEHWIKQYATRGLAASTMAAESLFGTEWCRDSRWKTLYYGVDVSALQMPVDRTAVRHELGIPGDAYVVGHVGRFFEQKNHKFIVEIAKELAKSDDKIIFLLVGDGPLRPEVESLIRRSGLAGRFRLTLVRSDVLRLMKGGMDLFLFPSLHEGLGLVLVEAQGAGLQCVCSTAIPNEADVVPQLVRRLPLTLPARGWAEAVLDRKAQGPLMERSTAFEAVTNSRFNPQARLAELLAEYVA